MEYCGSSCSPSPSSAENALDKKEILISNAGGTKKNVRHSHASVRDQPSRALRETRFSCLATTTRCGHDTLDGRRAVCICDVQREQGASDSLLHVAATAGILCAVGLGPETTHHIRAANTRCHDLPDDKTEVGWDANRILLPELLDLLTDRLDGYRLGAAAVGQLLQHRCQQGSYYGRLNNIDGQTRSKNLRV